MKKTLSEQLFLPLQTASHLLLLLCLLLVNNGFTQSTLVNSGGAKIVISAGTSLKANNVLNDGAGSQITNDGNLYVTGTFNQINGASYSGGASSWLWLEGTTPQTIQSDAPLNIARLRIDNAIGVQLSQDVNISTDLSILSGDLDLNGKNIDLGTTGTLTEDRANNHLVVDKTLSLSESNQGGYIRVSNRTTTGTLTQIAGLGIHLANAGTVSIDRYHYEGAGIAGGGVLKNYNITGTPTNATMRIEFAADELGGITPDNTFKLFRYNGTAWVNQGGTWTDAGVDYVQLGGINAFSPWTTGSGSGPLPISLVKFETQRIDNQLVSLTWQTASETNNRGFEVEQSNDGQTFQKVGFVDGNNNSNQIRNYSFLIANSKAAYYRLKQVDFDEKFSYSPIRFVGADARARAGLVVSPNPTTTRVRLRFEQSASQEVLHLIIYNAQGGLVWEGKGKLADLEAEVNRQLLQQPNGLLYLRLRSQVGVFEQKLVKY
jgi:hypothetical protein